MPDPAAKVFMSVSASVQSIRCTNWSLLISRLKKATRLGASFCFAPRRATFWAMFKARAVFPMEGRAARIMKSDGWRPVVSRSRSAKPVERPVTVSPFVCRELIRSMVWVRMS